MRARIFTDLDGVRGVAGSWDDLRRRVSASPFTSPALYLAWFEEHPRAARPFVVLVEDEGGAARAVAPWVSRGRIVFSLPGRLLVAGELVLDPRDGSEAWRAILAEAWGGSRMVAAFVPHLTPGPEGLAGAVAASGTLGLPWRAWPRFERYRLALAGGSFEGYLGSLSQSGRRFRKARRRLEALGTLTCRRLGGEEGYGLLRELHLRQWSPQRTISWLHTEEGARIDLRLVREFPSGVLVLELDGRPIAAKLWLDAGTRRTFYYSARALDVRTGSPGEVATVEAIRLAFEDGVTEIDSMGWGRNKEHVRFEKETGFDLVIGRPGWRGALAVRARAAQLARRRVPESRSSAR